MIKNGEKVHESRRKQKQDRDQEQRQKQNHWSQGAEKMGCTGKTLRHYRILEEGLNTLCRESVWVRLTKIIGAKT